VSPGKGRSGGPAVRAASPPARGPHHECGGAARAAHGHLATAQERERRRVEVRAVERDAGDELERHAAVRREEMAAVVGDARAPHDVGRRHPDERRIVRRRTLVALACPARDVGERPHVRRAARDRQPRAGHRDHLAFEVPARGRARRRRGVAAVGEAEVVPVEQAERRGARQRRGCGKRRLDVMSAGMGRPDRRTDSSGGQRAWGNVSSGLPLAARAGAGGARPAADRRVRGTTAPGRSARAPCGRPPAVEVEPAGVAQRAAGRIAHAAGVPVQQLARPAEGSSTRGAAAALPGTAAARLSIWRLDALLARVELGETGAVHCLDLRAVREEALPGPVAGAGDRQHQHDDQHVAVPAAHREASCAVHVDAGAPSITSPITAARANPSPRKIARTSSTASGAHATSSRPRSADR